MWVPARRLSGLAARTSRRDGAATTRAIQAGSKRTPMQRFIEGEAVDHLAGQKPQHQAPLYSRAASGAGKPALQSCGLPRRRHRARGDR